MRYLVPATLVANGLLILLSVAAAFLGARKAEVMFNSWPMAAYWGSLAVLLAASLLSKRVRGDLSLAAMHLGAVLVILGGMWGSRPAHELREKHWGDDKVQSGVMQVPLDGADDVVFDSRTGRFDRHLPFELRLDDFRIDYYGAQQAPELYVRLGGEAPTALDWSVGKDVQVGPLTVTVLEYLPRAQPVLQRDKAVLRVVAPWGATADVPAAVGQEVTVGQPPVKVRVTRVFENLVVREVDGRPAPVDVPGSHGPPALEVEVTPHDGPPRTTYVMYGYGGHHRQVGVAMEYDVPLTAQAAADGQAVAARVRVVGPGGQSEHWLVLPEGRQMTGMPLELPQGAATTAAASQPATTAGASAHGAESPEPAIFLVRHSRMPRQFHSLVTVLENGRAVRSGDISVNHPMHYGGYHFYQSDWDKEGEQFTVLTLTSDSGLAATAVGGAVLLAGVFGGMWLVPAIRYLRRRA